MVRLASVLPKHPRTPHLAVTALALLLPGTLILETFDPPSTPPPSSRTVGEPFVRPVTTVPTSHTASRSSQPIAGDDVNEGLLWLARCIYSETKRPVEQLLVAWVVRNRVETQYRGNTSYRDVVLAPYQFSAFNPDAPSRTFYTNLTVSARGPEWDQALRIARYVMQAPPSARPFSIMTRHFYSPRSMTDANPPNWAQNYRALRVEGHMIDVERFRFYTGLF